MILSNFDAKYGFGAVFGRVLPQICPQNHARGRAAPFWVAFGTRFEVNPAPKRLQNHI